MATFSWTLHATGLTVRDSRLLKLTLKNDLAPATGKNAPEQWRKISSY